MLLAKPYGSPPIKLTEHLNRVAEEAGTLVDAYPFCKSKYKKLTKQSLRDQAVRTGQYHDWGKAHPKWQKPCQADRDYHLKTGKYGNNLRNAGFRHELDSLRQANKNGLELSEGERAAIAAHHGKLSYKHKNRWLSDNGGTYIKEWEYFNGLLHGKYSKSSVKELLIKRYEIAGVRSFLRFADSRVSAREKGKNIPPIHHSFDIDVDQYEDPRPVQKAVLNHTEEQEIILRAPTGSGKTWAALLWANEQINVKKVADRLIIAMPTRFTSNSLSMDVGEDIDETGLYHSSAWFKYDQLKKEASQKEKDALDEELRLARYLMMPANITTIDHLLMCLTSTREDHHHIFFSMMHSCVVIDEADFYDPFIQANILKLLEVLRVFDIRIMIMSATVPKSASELYGIDTLVDPYNSTCPISEKARKEGTRTRCRIVRNGKMAPGKILDSVLGQNSEDWPPTIIFANTVRRALQYFDWFKDTAINPIIYHSRFTEPDKKRLEDKVISKLGKEAWEEGSAEGVVILTQIGEMSLNISAPMMISDICPFDRLAQRAGRLSRFEDMEAGTMHTVVPVKDEAIYPAPYGEYDREKKQWIAYAAFNQTVRRLKNGSYSAADFTEEVNKLYPDSKPFEGQAKSNQEMFTCHIKNNWLILPGAEMQEGDFEAGKWRSRNIPQQQTVLTHMPDKYMSYREYQEFELKYGVSCPIYQISKAKSFKKKRVYDAIVYVGNEEKEESILVSNAYSETIGLILDENRKRPIEDQMIG